jgi:hypothetical protein
VTAETNGQASYGTGPKPPDPSEVVEHLKAASQEIAAAGKAFFDMVEQAMGGLFGAVSNWAGWNEPPGAGEKPRVEHIDVEDERKRKDE